MCLVSFLCLAAPLLATPRLARDETEPKVAVETAKARYKRGETITIKVRNGLAEPIFLPGCNRVDIERAEADGWRRVYELRCFWEGFILEVETGADAEFPRDCKGFEPGRYRVHVHYRQGCKKGKAMSQADCTGGGECSSPEFRVE